MIGKIKIKVFGSVKHGDFIFASNRLPGVAVTENQLINDKGLVKIIIDQVFGCVDRQLHMLVIYSVILTIIIIYHSHHYYCLYTFNIWLQKISLNFSIFFVKITGVRSVSWGILLKQINDLK